MMDNTRINLITPVNSGDMIKEMKGISRSLKSCGKFEPDFLPEGGNNLFSEKLKELALDDRIVSRNPSKKLREPDAGLNPVRPVYEKQGGAKGSPSRTDNQVISDGDWQQVSSGKAEISSSVADSSLQHQENQQTLSDSDKEILNAFGYNINISDESAEKLSEIKEQSPITRLEEVYAPVKISEEETADDPTLNPFGDKVNTFDENVKDFSEIKEQAPVIGLEELYVPVKASEEKTDCDPSPNPFGNKVNTADENVKDFSEIKEQSPVTGLEEVYAPVKHSDKETDDNQPLSFFGNKVNTADENVKDPSEIKEQSPVTRSEEVYAPVKHSDKETDDDPPLNPFGSKVDTDDENAKDLSEGSDQQAAIRPETFIPPVNVDAEQFGLPNGITGEKKEESESISGVSSENGTKDGLVSDTVKVSAVNYAATQKVTKTEKTEDGNLPLQNGDDNDDSEKVSSRPVQSAYQGKLYKGTLSDLIKQGEIVFGNIFSLTVTDKGIFIGGEGDSKDNEANLVNGDFLQKLYEILGERLENPEQLTDRDQLRQMLISAIQKAVSAMHDPVKKEEEYQQKLLEFLMKFVDAINGKDDEDKKTVLDKEDKDKDKDGLLFQLIENLIEAAKRNSDDKEYTAAIYVSAFEIGRMTPDQSLEQNEKAEEDTSTAAVEQISDSNVKANPQASEYRNTETQIPAEDKIPVVHKAVENAADVTEINNDKAVSYVHQSEVIEGPRMIPVYDSAEKEMVSPVIENADTDLFENIGARSAEENSELLKDAGNQSIAVDAVRTEKTANDTNSGVISQKTEGPVSENAPEIGTQALENTQKAEFNSIYKVSQPVEEDSQSSSDSVKKSVIPPALQFRHKVRGASDEIDELKRLFGVKNRDEEKMKEKNELIEKTEETDENRKDENGRTEQRTAFTKDGQTAQRAIGKDGSKEDFQKSIIEAVTLETVKTDTAPVARGYAAEENGAKQIVAQILSEMLNSLSSSSNPGRTVTTLTMTLTPESLGKITMKISEEAGKISLLVTAHNKETAEILSQRMDAMQQAAKDSGTQLEKYQVVYGPEQDGRAGQQNYDGSSKNPYVRQDAEETRKEDDSRFEEFLKQAV